MKPSASPPLTQRPDLLLYGKLASQKVGYVAGQIEITSACSQRCFMCDSWKQHKTGQIKGTIPYHTLVNLFNELDRMPTFEHLTFTGGDPQDWKDQEGFLSFDPLLEMLQDEFSFSLQVNTALIKPLNPKVWRRSLNRVRVSLDAIKQETYRIIRGDNRDPEEILERMEILDHRNLSTMTCVSDHNIDEIPSLIRRLNKMKSKPRKMMFLPAMGVKLSSRFHAKYRRLKNIYSTIPTSFAEDTTWVRTFVESLEASDIRCWGGAITFHIKCNGDVYPCCLVGGEAIKTWESFKIGNIYDLPLEQIQQSYTPREHYYSTSPCCDACQWKQLMLNCIGEEASRNILAMP